jgi:hypothetical protein
MFVVVQLALVVGSLVALPDVVVALLALVV